MGFGLQTLKTLDQQRYLASLYIPEKWREDVAAIWAFDAEVARIPSLVSEPMPGEIRIQWWRDLLTSGNKDGSGPLAEALLTAIEKHDLPPETFYTYLEARTFDLYNDPMPDTGSFEGYLGETVSVHLQNAALCLGAERTTLLADACGHAGMALGIAKLLARLAIDRARRQIFVPMEMVRKRGVSEESWLDGEISEGHLQVVEDLCQLCQYHATFAQSVIGELPRALRPVFLQLAVVKPSLKAIRKAEERLFVSPVSLSPLGLQWAFFRASMR
ncbi:MAG: phytoene/squalene synthase family protein [Pseudomonadota bacterium]